MKKILITSLLLAALAYIWQNVEPIYGNCKSTIDGRVCTLQGYDWKGNK